MSGGLRGKLAQTVGHAAEVIKQVFHRRAEVAVHALERKRLIAGEIASDLIEIAHTGREMAGGAAHRVERGLERCAHIVEARIAVGILREVIQVDDAGHGGDITGKQTGRARSVAHAAQKRIANGLKGGKGIRIIVVSVFIGHFKPVIRTLGNKVIASGAVGIICSFHQPAQISHGGIQSLGRDREIVGGRFEGGLIGVRHLIDRIQRIESIVKVAGRHIQRHAALAELRNRGRHHLLRGVHADHQFVNRAGRVIHEISGLLRHIARMLRRAGSTVGNGADRGADAGCSVARMSQQDIHQIVQAVEIGLHFGSASGTHIDRNERLHLTCNAADVLAAGHVAPVGAARNQSALTADDAADVDADVLIAHRAPVGAADDHAGGKACNTADVRSGVHFALFVRDLFHGGIIAQLGIGFVCSEVYPCGIGAIRNRAEVLPDRTADIMVAGSIALSLAVIDHAGGLIGTCNTADVICTADRAGEVASADRAEIGSNDRADLAHCSGSVNVSGDGQILDRAALLNIAEKAHMRSVALERKAADGMALAVKDTAKSRYRRKHNAVQIQISLKNNRLVSGISIEFAVLAELLKVFHRSNADHILVRNGGACSAQEAEHNRQKNCDCPTFITFHWNPPPRQFPGSLLYVLHSVFRRLRMAVGKPSRLY